MSRVVILGGGESGFGSAVLAKKEGFDVFLSDKSVIKDDYKRRLEEWSIDYEEGGHSYDKILNADEVIKSPGIPDNVEVVKKIKKKNIPVISEIEFAGRYTSAKMICVTGSNGKTTTTTLIYQLLKEGSLNVGVAGNIGDSFAYQVATEKHDWYVLELSSFQLDGMFDFKADIAVLTNITPDHLNRYDYKMENYVNSKFRIIRNQTESDFFIYSIDDKYTMDYVLAHKEHFVMKSLPFTIKDTLLDGAYLNRDANIDVNVNDQEIIVNPNKLKIKGSHNIYNSMAAIMAAVIAGVDKVSIVSTLENFAGVEHRLEYVIERDGIVYINDSKATNVDSVYYALESMNRPTIWIAGGEDKGNDYSQISEIAKRNVRVLICMGIDNQKLEDYFQGIVPFVYSTNTFDEAMNRMRSLARNGDCVLLSPACASFDLFKNYEDRGQKFKEFVLNEDNFVKEDI